MNRDTRMAVRQVLNEAAEHEHFFDFSDAERLTWMIERAFVIGVRSVNAGAVSGSGVESRKASRRQSTARRPRGSRNRKS